jgi:MarR family 2-MHQ and catechol resistance regulon transcriptional repressor
MGTKYEGTVEEILALDTYVKFVRAYDTMRSRIDAQNSTGSLNGSQFGTLEMIYYLGPQTQKDIGHKLLVSKSNVVTVIDKLEEHEFVRRERSLEDRRCVFVHLTDAGRDEIEQIMPVHFSAIYQEMGYLNAAEQKTFGRLCRKLGLGE